MRRRGVLLGLAGLVGLSAACGGSELEPPGPLEILIRPVGSSTLSLERLRLALLFRGADGVRVTRDIALTSTGADLPFTLRAPLDLEIPAPQTTVAIGTDGFGLRVQAARFVPYLDLDGSESFQDGRGLTGPDQVLGLESFFRTFGWVIDAETQLGAIPPEAAAAYYDATGGSYAAFVPMFRVNGAFQALTSTVPLPVEIDRHAIAPVDLACDRDLRVAPDPPARVRLLVDDRLDAETLCGLELADCAAVTLGPRPVTSTVAGRVDANPFVDERLQCRRRGGLEVFVREIQRLRCRTSDCGCGQEITVEAVATTTTAPPAWWPCGDEAVVDCPSDAVPLYRADPACVPLDSDE